MEYTIKFSCGHTETKQLFGKTSERERKIAYLEKYGVCSVCYREMKEMEKAAGCEEVEMFFGDYKKNYANCKTKAGSYNGTTKTIVVYVPKTKEDKKAHTMAQNEDIIIKLATNEELMTTLSQIAHIHAKYERLTDHQEDANILEEEMRELARKALLMR